MTAVRPFSPSSPLLLSRGRRKRGQGGRTREREREIAQSAGGREAGAKPLAAASHRADRAPQASRLRTLEPTRRTHIRGGRTPVQACVCECVCVCVPRIKKKQKKKIYTQPPDVSPPGSRRNDRQANAGRSLCIGRRQRRPGPQAVASGAETWGSRRLLVERRLLRNRRLLAKRRLPVERRLLRDRRLLRTAAWGSDRPSPRLPQPDNRRKLVTAPSRLVFVCPLSCGWCGVAVVVVSCAVRWRNSGSTTATVDAARVWSS